ncbi:Crp/Fnr family transcriptional regulator [Ureibacillus xyleni]|nr:cyclic nucleotide-binding domain-containing protein [Ureibacillus xyleni]
MRRHTPFNEEEIQRILNELVVETFPKKTVLLKQGEIATNCYFVLKGCIRQFTINDDGKEVTIDYTYLK